jgi:tetratricopeptide (TPR) repeat protein
MLGFAWLTLRQAQEALKSGRLEEAQRLLSQPEVQAQRGVGALLAQLARAFAERGERCLRQDDVEAAWRDLIQAEQLQTAERSPERLRQALMRLGVAEVRAQLQAGEPQRAEEAAARLKSRGARTPELQVLEEAARGWLGARQLADRGEFAQALEALQRTRRMLPDVSRPLEQSRAEMDRRQAAFAEVQPRLHEAADAGNWRDVAELAEQVLALAPLHAEARRIRGLAWKAVEPATIAMAHPDPPAAEPEPGLPPPRFLLWVDGVGGYLVCLGGRITLGQAGPDARADVPFIADVSRLHAVLTRDPEGYLLEGLRELQVNGRTTSKALLRDGDRVTLGSSCQFVFRLPASGSTTARLDLVSGHRLPLGVDSVVLMSDALVLGSGPQAHLEVPDLKKPVILFRHKDGLGVRCAGTLQIDGQKSPERALLSPRSFVTCDDASFALEPVGARMGFG